jgi:competence transcription factor ComK
MNPDAGASSTECVHIFPQPITTISGIDDKNTKVRFADLASVAINRAYFNCSTSMPPQFGLS